MVDNALADFPRVWDVADRVADLPPLEKVDTFYLMLERGVSGGMPLDANFDFRGWGPWLFDALRKAPEDFRFYQTLYVKAVEPQRRIVNFARTGFDKVADVVELYYKRA